MADVAGAHAVNHGQAEEIYLLKPAFVVADGAPDEVLSPDLIRDVFGITAWIDRTEHSTVFQPLEVVG